MNTCEKYWWVLEHPAFINKDGQTVIVEIEPHMVCPMTNRIESYEPLNTKLQLWIEVMIPYKEENETIYTQAHDWELDCGGFTYEEAIDNLYKSVKEKYGDYTEEERQEKYDSVYNIKANRQNIFNRYFKSKPLATNKEDLTKWSKDILEDYEYLKYEIEIQEMKDTIAALTEHRKTCNIEEYDEIDSLIESERFKIFEAELSLRYYIDLVRV